MLNAIENLSKVGIYIVVEMFDYGLALLATAKWGNVLLVILAGIGAGYVVSRLVKVIVFLCSIGVCWKVLPLVLKGVGI